MLCLISASFTGCIEDKVENTVEEETTQEDNTNDPGNDIGFFVTINSVNQYFVNVIKVKDQLNLTDLSFFLRDSSGGTYVGGNGFGQIGMEMMGDELIGIDADYGGNDENFKARAKEINDDDGSTYPVKFFDEDRDSKLSAGDLFIIYGPDVGPVYDGWKLDIQYDVTGDIIGSARMM